MILEVESINGEIKLTNELSCGISVLEVLVEGKAHKMTDIVVDKDLQIPERKIGQVSCYLADEVT